VYRIADAPVPKIRRGGIFSVTMALHLRFSHRTEGLLDGLDALLEHCWTDLGAPPVVVVPSPSCARWLKLRLCERRGPLVGLGTTTLESFLWRALEPEPDDQILRVPVLQQALLAILDAALLERPEYGGVRRFLAPEGPIDACRTVQFAHEMARLFLEYEYNRPSVWNGAWAVAGLDRTWPETPYFRLPGREESETEAWQRDLHRRVFHPLGPLGSGAGLPNALGLPRLHRLRHDGGWTPEGVTAILFGVDKVSHFHRNLLLELSEVGEVHAFLHNPCAEFWEDLDTSRRPSRDTATRPPPASLRLRRDDTGDDWQAETLPERCYPSAQDDPLLLERWGRTARENITLWCQAADYDFQESGRPELPCSRTLLGLLQESLRQRHPGPLETPLSLDDGDPLSGAVAPDASLALLEAPDRGREMETVRDQILSWLEEDPARRPSDVVVYLPDPARHRVEIERVFGGLDSSDPGHLTWTLVGASASESLWARGTLDFLRLVRGPLDRPSVFALLRNELCRARIGSDVATLALWEDWFEGAGMIRDWDASDRRDERDPGSAHTLRTGILRLLTSSLSGPDGVELPGLDTPLPPWRDFSSSDPDLLEPFCTALERLQADRIRLREEIASLPPVDAGQALARCLDAWLDPSSHPQEASARRGLLDGLRHLERRTSAPLRLDELTEIVTSMLDGELPGSARAWSGAVTFAPLRAGHILPHGLVLIPGLDADAFPGEPSTSSLDLLAARRIIGDPDVVADNRHAFLLALLAARDRLVLSWRARDIQKDERKDPSSVVLEFEEALRRGFQPSSLRRRIRLLEREAPLDPALELSDPGWDTWTRPVPEFSPPVPSRETVPDSATVRVSSRKLARFLLDSWSHRIEHDLEAQDEGRPDTLGTSDEPLDSSPLAHTRLRGALFPTLLASWWNGLPDDEVRSLARRAHRRSLWNGDAPEGIQARREESALMEWVDRVRDVVASLRAEWPAHRLETGCDLALRRSGASGEWPLRLADGRDVRLGAHLDAVLVGPDPGSPVIVLACVRSNDRDIPLRKRLEHQLRAWLLERVHGTEVRTVLVSTLAGGPIDLPTLPPAADEAWIAAVVTDLLDGAHEFLPAAAVVDSGATSLEALREAIEEASWRTPLERLLEPSLPGEDSGDGRILSDLVARRLGPLLHPEPGPEEEA